MKRQKLFAVILCAAMLLSLLPTTALADGPVKVYVTEDITTDTTWQEGEYYICKTADNDEPKVMNGATLTIESGAKVYFSTRTNTALPGTESAPKHPYSSLTVTNGTLYATGVTFTTVPDVTGTEWQSAGWQGITALGAGPGKPTGLSFTDCIFEHDSCGENAYGTIKGEQTNDIDSVVNISVSGCTFRTPNRNDQAAITYLNGSNTVGSGTISITGSNFTGCGRGVQVLDNGDDAVNTTVTGCTFSNISIRPVEINGGRQAVVTGNIFNDFVAGQHSGAILIYDTDAATGINQAATLTGNTFNYGSTASIYPVLIGAGCKINENATNPANTFGSDYPAAYQYIVLSRGIGYATNSAYRNAVWGEAGIPYLLTSEIVIAGTDADQSTLTIKPGVTVCLGDGSGSDNLTVRGTLTAIGTAAKPITFTKMDGLTYGNEITASNNLQGSVTLKHCVMDGLYRGVGITSPSTSAGQILLEDCTIRNTQEPMVLNGYNVSVKNCTLIGKGIWIDGGSYITSIEIEGCSITASGVNSGAGVGIRNTKSVTVKNSLITGFSGSGVSINNNSYPTVADGAPLIENCTITGNGHGVVFSCNGSFNYGAYVKNSIVTGNTSLDLANQVYASGSSSYYATMPEGSISYSLIGDDGSSLLFTSGYYEHASLGKIRQISAPSYSNRVTGDPLFVGGGDYHLQSAGGRWNGSAWVTDTDTSPCIDAGDPASPYEYEPTPNGDRINLGCYGNTAQASKTANGGTPPDPPPITNCTITVSASPVAGGMVSGGGSVDTGSSVTVTATAYADYRFVKWTEAGTQVSASASYTFTAASNRTLVAVFESIPPYDPPTPPSPPPAPVTEINSGGSVTASNISRLIASDEALTVQGEDGAELVFDTEALEGIGEQASGSVQIEIADVSGEYVETHPDKLVFSLTVKSGDKTITDFGGSVAVSLPYELKEGEAAENVTVWHLTANGVLIEIPCTYDAATGLASFTVSHFSVYIVGVAGEWANPFDDVDEADWFYDEVRFIYENNLMVGTGEATFSPLASTSRGMIVTILWRLEGKPEATLPMTFTDVADGQWYYDAVAWAAEKAIVDGYDITRFGPEDDITREQMAKILIAYADYKGKNTSASNDLSAFTDTPSSWALQSVSWAVAEGLMQGKGGGILDPQGGAKRCECAAIFQRFQYIIAGM
jgi:hypothetical protein